MGGAFAEESSTKLRSQASRLTLSPFWSTISPLSLGGEVAVGVAVFIVIVVVFVGYFVQG